jgi:hypothetical protein
MLAYVIIGLLLWGSFDHGPPGWRAFYACIFPVHVLAGLQLKGVLGFLGEVKGETWKTVLFWLFLIGFVFLTAG